MSLAVATLVLLVASSLSSHILCATAAHTPFSEYRDMIRASVCSNVDHSFEQRLVSSVTLKFFYGEGESSFVEVALRDADRFVHHARWRPERRIALYFFGYNSAVSAPSTRSAVLAYAGHSQRYNLLVVDWAEVTSQRYSVAVAAMEAVARAVAAAVDVLVGAGATVSHIVGHSLGAQAAGATARFAAAPIPSVVALDPAGPLFYSESMPGQQCAPAVGPSDAECVLALHTCMGSLGSPVATGHVDFFPQGGRAPQPGCGDLWSRLGVSSVVCSHERAVELWAEAVRNTSAVVGRLCASWQDFRESRCSTHPTALLGRCGALAGEFFLETNAASPFGRGQPGATIE